MKQMTSKLRAYGNSASNIGVSRGGWGVGAVTGFVGGLVLRGNLFLVTLAKIFIIILVVKQIT